ncbi:cyclic nucleotide-binding domain-containing protein [Candidatus Protofrankia californiensis]|uniref:cyclic nucleotide-binding domain-containing protein n=1 Tax=Candidatus Protofrankia californiensis TaxID=1839754 RepID=UPI001F49561C|nr:cyclic nucleotide-binding domain-containing protein [Candidatus Protofrankia californiensis]
MTTAGTSQPAETPDLYGAYPRLSDDQLEALAAHGRRRRVQAGEVLVREGERAEEFLVILRGKILVITSYGTDDARVIRVHGPRRFLGEFLGELGLLEGQVSFFTVVAGQPSEILAVPLDVLRDVLQRDIALGDLIVRAYFLRRSMLIGLEAGFRIIGSRYCPDSRRLREFAARNRLPRRFIDLEQDGEAEKVLHNAGLANRGLRPGRSHRMIATTADAAARLLPPCRSQIAPRKLPDATAGPVSHACSATCFRRRW